MEEAMPTSHNPIRCFEGDAKPHQPFWNLVNVVDGGEPMIELDGYISEYSWFDDDVTPKMFRDDLNAHGAGGPVTIRLHSYGGDVIAASVMHGIIKDYPGQVTVQIDGIAASAATVVAVAGDHIQMQETAYFMIHDPSMVFFMAQINIEDMSKMLDSLKAVKEGILNAYKTKTGLSRTRLSKLMADETWMDAQKAADLGFVDEIIRGESKKLEIPKNTAVVNALHIFSHVPPALLQALQPVNTPEEAPNGASLPDDVLREAQTLRDRVQSILRKDEPCLI
jgi:ATP-dependent Clp protease protease subunit